jgi:hypothetical protein
MRAAGRMFELKTQKNDGNIEEFLNTIEHNQKREDSYKILDIMREVTGEEPFMWGPSIVGFGSYTYKYASGREGEWFLTGFSPRKQSITLYIMSGFEGFDSLLEKLGKYRTGKSCLYINKLEDIEMDVLRELIMQSVVHKKKGNG